MGGRGGGRLQGRTSSAQDTAIGPDCTIGAEGEKGREGKQKGEKRISAGDGAAAGSSERQEEEEKARRRGEMKKKNPSPTGLTQAIAAVPNDGF